MEFGSSSDHGKRTFIILYVDDLLIMTEDDEELASLKRGLTARFEMKDLGEVKRFLGMEIEHESNGIKIHQADYIRTLLHRHGMQDCNSVNTPMDPSIKLLQLRTRTLRSIPHSTSSTSAN